MDVTEILKNLNESQEQAVTSDNQHLLVLAGAGSGKTRVLVHRIAWKVQVENISPFGILAVTFTNKAAGEMRDRIETLLAQSLRGMWVGTFHGLAHRLLKLHWNDAKLPENFQKAEHVQSCGFVDSIVHRKELTNSIGMLISILLKNQSEVNSDINNETQGNNIQDREAS